MKKLLALFLFVLLFCRNVFGVGGELQFKSLVQKSGFKYSVTITQINGTKSFIMNPSGIVIQYPGVFYDTFEGFKGFDAPDDIASDKNVLPWGYYKIEIIIYENEIQVKSLTIFWDFRDENWTRGIGTTATDTFVVLNLNGTNDYFITVTSTGNGNIFSTDTISLNQSENTRNFTIWQKYNRASPKQDNFGPPVTFYNRNEGQMNSFGHLFKNNKEVNSGSQENVSELADVEILEGTINYNNGGIDSKGLRWQLTEGLNVNSKYTYKTSTFTKSSGTVFERNIIRLFRTTRTLTVKNLLEGTTTSDGSFYLKDPIYNVNNTGPLNLNLFVSKNIPTNGWLWSEAYENLNDEIAGNPNQQYSIQAVPTFTDANNVTWQWMSGDFNPTTATDLLLTGNLTKTSNYKGQLLSTTSGWVQNDMVNFNGKRAVVYKSQSKLWLHLENCAGTFKKEIELFSGTCRDYSVVQQGTDTYVSYVNSLNDVFVKRIDASGNVVSTTQLVGPVPASVKPKLLVGKNTYVNPQCQGDPDECPSTTTYYLGIYYQNGTTVYSQYQSIGGTWTSSWSSPSWSTYLNASSIVQSATNGENGYLYWTKDNIAYSGQFKGWWDSPVVVSNNSTSFASNIYHVAGSVDQKRITEFGLHTKTVL